METSGRSRLVAAFVVLLVLVGAASVAIASSQEDALEPHAGGPKPPGWDPADAPLAGGRGADQLLESLREQRERDAAREQRLASPELRAERERSRTAFVGLSDTQAEGLVEEEFAPELDGLGVPDFDDLARGRAVKRFVDDNTVVLAGDGDRPPVLLEAPRALRAVNGEGRKRRVDLSLEPSGAGFEPANAAADVILPDQLAEGVEVGPATVTPAGSADGALSGTGEDERIVYANAQPDTDVVITPVTNGVEVFWQLRSPRAPEELTLDLELPDGAVAQKTSTGSISIVRDGEAISTVSAPVALDAQGQEVEVGMEPIAGRIVLSVAHRDEDLAYPILVDPVWEDWYGSGTETWFHQDPVALAGLNHWFHTYGGVPAQTYAPRSTCYTPVSCYRFGPEHDDALADGLHMYVRPNTAYPAGSAAQWLYQPPGTTTRINRADLGVKYLRMRSGSNQSPVMFTGIWRVGGPWLSSSAFNQDFSNHWNTHLAGAQAGPHQLVFGFFAPVASAGLPTWRDGYVGSAIVELTDPEAPAITSKGLTRSDGGDATKWVKDDVDFLVRPTATDPGLGAQYFEITGPGVVQDYAVHPTCTGTKSAPCPSSWTAPADQTMVVSTDGLPEGVNNVDLYAEDVIGHRSGTFFGVKVDRGAPSVALSGAVWDAREVSPAPPGGQQTLQPGQHQLTVAATDPAQGPAPQGTRSGVEKIEVKVDGDTVHSSTAACPAGNCSRTIDWTFDTAQFGGRSTIEVLVTDGAGNTKTDTFHVNSPARGQMTLPVDGETTSRRLALQAKANEDGFTAVEFQYRRTPIGAWTTIGGAGTTLRDDRGELVMTATHPLDQPNRHTKRLIWNVEATLQLFTPSSGPIQVRAVFTGNGTFKSQPMNAELDLTGDEAGNATAAIGPGSVDLLTGNFAYTAEDATLAGFGQSVTLTRTFNSNDQSANEYSSFGPGWVPSAPVDGVSAFSSLRELQVAGMPDRVEVTTAAAMRIKFEKQGDGTYKPEQGSEALTLTKSGSSYEIADLDGVVTTFTKPAGSLEFVPSTVEQPTQGAGTLGAARYFYVVGSDGEPRLQRIIAAAPPGLDCTVAVAQLPRGCRVFELEYFVYPPYSRLTGVSHIAYDPATATMKTDQVAQYDYYLSGPHLGKLEAAYDPRTPALKERYTYNSSNQLATIEHAGQAPWSLTYAAGRLSSVSRTVQGSGLESWRTSFGVPLSGAGAPYPMAASDLDAWGQTDRPTDATAILPPDQVGGGFSRATVYYLDHDGRTVNTVAPGGRTTTTEHDAKGNVVRELTAANRAKALAAGGGSATLAGLLSTYNTYSADGLRLVEELGPQHEVRLDSGQLAQARAHTVTSYDEGSTLPADKPAHLPTTVRTGAQVDPSQPDVDVRVTRTEYDWALRKPTATIVDAESGGLNITHRTVYDAAGLELESRQPKSNGADAGTTKTIYYSHDTSSPDTACQSKPEWFNLPCKVKPAAQPGGMQLPATTYSYNRFGQVTEAKEAILGIPIRTTTTTYDAAGREVTSKVTGVGSAVEEVTTGYSSTTGLPTTTSTPSGTITTAYDDAGRVTSYTDADGNTSTTSYDNLNRPVTTGDGKGTQTRAYDPGTGFVSSLTDSHAGTFTASYDEDGRTVAKTYPNGMVAETTYDEAGSPTRLKYTKTTNCSANCTWIDEQVGESVHGQWRTHDWELSSQEYGYDKAGRLTRVQDDVHAPAAVDGCTIREYSFDANSNRTAMTTKAPDANGDCMPASQGTQTTYSHDSADRLTGTGITYDALGRTTQIPGQYAGGGVLAYTYYVNDQVRTMTQDGVSKTYSLDPAGRQRQTVTSGGTTHTETLHYQDGSDSPAWTRVTDGQGQEVSWERNVEGIDGDLAAVRTHDGQGDETILQLQNLHGDVVATAATDPQATALLKRFESDEFGNARQQSDRRFAWLGGKQRRTELVSGVIQMGVRSYVPALGRFTSVDPVQGGSATAYDYGNADPVNQFDLDGRIPGAWSCNIRTPRVKQRRKGQIRARYRFKCEGEVSPRIKFTARIRRHRGGILKPDATEHYVTSWTSVGGAKFYEDWDGPCEPGKRYHADIEIWFWLKRGTRDQRGPYSIRRRGPSITCTKWK